jgi:hypothetical protein
LAQDHEPGFRQDVMTRIAVADAAFEAVSVTLPG